MRVILQEKVPNLGSVGDQVMVKRGFARNYLIPLGKAILANANNLVEFEKRRAELEKKAADVLVQAQQRADKLGAVVVTIESQAGEEGKLFGSIGTRDIAEAVTASGVELNKSEVRMPQGPIRQVGEYDIDIQLHHEIVAKVKVKIVAV